MLTGKYKRNEKPKASFGRVGFVAENETTATEYAPAWSKMDCDFYWKLREVLEQIAKEHGRTTSLDLIFTCIFFILYLTCH